MILTSCSSTWSYSSMFQSTVSQTDFRNIHRKVGLLLTISPLYSIHLSICLTHVYYVQYPVCFLTSSWWALGKHIPRENLDSQFPERKCSAFYTCCEKTWNNPCWSCPSDSSTNILIKPSHFYIAPMIRYVMQFKILVHQCVILSEILHSNWLLALK